MNTRLLTRIFLAAVLASVISLGAPQAFAGEEEDAASSEAAEAADQAADAADDAWDEYEKQKTDAKDKGDSDKDAEKAAAEAKKAAEKAEADAKKAADASKAADDTAKKADDKEIENRADKKEKADKRKKRHDKRAARRKARAHLRGLKAELAKRKRIGGEEDSSKTKELEKEIKDLEKSLGTQPAQPPPKEPVPLPGSELSLLGQVIASGKASTDIAGTGETIGHVADLKIQNLTDQPLTFVIPAMILESASRKNQHYACPRGQSVTLDPQQTKTVPMNGVCLNRNKPPVGKGVSGDLVINEANPNVPPNPNSHVSAADASRLLQICTSKYEAADKLQKEGALKSLPYRDPQKQKNIVVQWSTWTDPVICQMTGSPPATKEDLREVVYKQVKEPMTPATKKKIDKGIDTIFEKVELTSAKAKELEKPGAVVAGPLSSVELTSAKAKDLEKPVAFFKPASVAQPGDVVHVEPQGPRDREGAPGVVGAKGRWMVKVKLPSGEIVEVWFETDEKPALKVCNWIKIKKTGTSAGGKTTVIEDYEETTEPTPTATATPPPTPTPTPTAAPPTVPESVGTPTPPSTSTPTPTVTQPPQPPGGTTEAEKPKEGGAKPGETWPEPPFELPHWLEPWWEALKAGTGIVPTDLPGGKDALGLVIAKLNVEIRNAMAAGNDKKAEFYEDLKEKLQKLYNNMPDKK